MPFTHVFRADQSFVRRIQVADDLNTVDCVANHTPEHPVRDADDEKEYFLLARKISEQNVDESRRLRRR